MFIQTKKVSRLSDATTTASTTLTAGEGIAIESDTVKVEADVLADLNTAKSNITSLQATTSSLSVKNVLPNVWQSVIFWDSTAGIGNVPLTVDTSAGRPPYFELIRIPFGDYFIVKVRGLINLGNPTANGDVTTAKDVLLTTLAAEYIPKYTHSFTINGHTGQKTARVDVYGNQHPTVAERGKVVFLFGASDIGIQYINLCQLEWMTN